jgi:hypothetical protein
MLFILDAKTAAALQGALLATRREDHRALAQALQLLPAWNEYANTPIGDMRVRILAASNSEYLASEAMKDD